MSRTLPKRILGKLSLALLVARQRLAAVAIFAAVISGFWVDFTAE
jgi:hypothetical protein